MFGSGSGSGSSRFAWPELDELKQVLDVTSDDWDGDLDNSRLTRLLAAAIAQVKDDVGNWDELTDQPDAKLAQAALQMAYLISPKIGGGNLAAAAALASNDPTYQALLSGHRRRFSIS